MQNLEHGQQYKNIKIKIMGSLSNLYISQSYQSLIHLGTNNTASANLIELQDGLGNSIGVAVNTNGDLFLSGSLTASLQQGYLYVGGANGKTTAFATSSLVTNINTGSLVTTSSFNSYTQSTNIRLDNLETTSASVNISISNLNSTTASQGVSITNLNSATQSLFSSASLALVTASFDNGTRNLTFTKGDTSTFNVNIPDASGSAGNFVTTSSFNAYTQSNDQRVSSLETNSASVNISISNINTFTQSANISINALNAATSSYATSAITASSLITASVNLNTITFTKGDGTTFPITVNTGSGGGGGTTDTGSLMVTGSIAGNILTFTKGDASTFDLTIPSATGSIFDTGSFATTGSNSFNGDQNITGSVRAGVFIVGSVPQGPTIQSLDSGTPEGNTSLQVNAGASGSFSLRTLYGAGVGKAILEAYDTYPAYNTGGKIEALSNGGLNLIGYAGNIQSTAPLASAVVDNGFVVARQGNLQGGVYMNTTSGSLVLTPSGFSATSSSLLHLSSSSNTSFVNLIFKNNNNTADTIISGSGNIFTNPAAPTAGFKRYIGGGGNIINTAAAPLISSSMQFSPSMNANYIVGGMTMRGPVSSSAWLINSNNVIGTVNIGSSAANNAEKIVGGLQLTINNIPGTLNIIANQSNLSASVSVAQNTLSGTTTLTFSSSAALFNNNTVIDSGFTFINQYYSGSTGAGQPQMNRNIIIGAANAVLLTGTLDVAAGTTQPNLVNNLMGGASNTIFVNATSASISHNLQSTITYGNTLIVSASSAAATTATIGSAFFGRFNANDGIRNKSAQNVFSVGTGTSTSARKTGFLIDSGSNTFVEGTFNVSGSSSFTGSLTISGSIITVDRSGNNGNTYLGLNALGMGSAGVQPLALGNTVSVAIGQGAMRYASGSQQNVAIGIDALKITSGSNNFALGSYSLESNTTGGENVALGTGALNKNISGQRNIALGGGALFGSTFGDFNIGVGYNTGAALSGSTNVFLGYRSGENFSGSKNVLIGGYKGVGETLNNNIILSDGEGNIKAQYSGSNWNFTNTTISGSLIIQSGSSFFANGNKQFNVGAFQSNVSQSGSANVSQSMNFETTDISEGVTIVSNSQITLANSGTYNIQFSAQLLADTGADNVYIWLKKNGTNVAGTAGHVVLANNDELIATWNYVVNAAASDYYELVWQSSAGDAILLAEAATGNIPSIPSVILTVTQVR